MQSSKKMINFTNHPTQYWSKKQYGAALELVDEIMDIPFPMVNPELSSEEVQLLAQKYVEMIEKENPALVLCQGEFNLAYYVIYALKENGVPVVAACSKRIAKEEMQEGVVEKKSVFEFVQFREY